MRIKEYILDSYNTVNPYAATNSLGSQFYEKGYAVVIDDNNEFYGVLTTCDLIKRPHKLVVDCLTEKDYLSSDCTIISVIENYKKYQCSIVPVFESNSFIGVVEIQSLLYDFKSKIIALHDKSLISQRAKTEFLRNLSHEIRTPLNGILGFMDLISLTNYNNINLAKEIIKNSADRFLLVMNDLVELAVLDSGDDIKIEHESVNIESVFSDLKRHFEKVISMSNENISIQIINPDISFVMFSDGKRIKQILYHLIDNAIKFSSENGIVTLGFEMKNSSIQFFVTNTGSEITQDREKMIFDIFYKQDIHDTKLVNGLGIGLSLVKRLSELLNGTVHFETNSLQTTFICNIPNVQFNSTYNERQLHLTT